MLEFIFKNPLYKKHRELLLGCIDLGIVIFAFFIAYWAKINFNIPNLALINYPKLVFSLIGVSLTYTICFALFKIQKSMWKYTGSYDAFKIACSVGISTLILEVIVAMTGFDTFYFSVVFIGGVLSLLVLFNARLCYRLLRTNYRKDNEHVRERAIIIGAGDGGYILHKQLQQSGKYNVEVVGFVDDKRHDKVIAGISVLGGCDDIGDIVQKYAIDIAFIAIPSADKDSIRRIYDICLGVHLKTKIMKRGDAILKDSINEEKSYPIQDISIEDLLGRGEIHLQQNEISSYISDKIVCISGAGGSIGSELCRQIMKFEPKMLLMIDINENSLYMLEQEFMQKVRDQKLNGRCKIISLIVSIRDVKAIDDVFKQYKPFVVFHAAAHKHVPLMETRPQEAIKNNVFGTYNVIKACIKHQVERFIMISTDKAVNPTNVMGATKRMTEMILQANGSNGVTKMAAVRFGNVLGSNGSVIPIFKKQISEGGPVTITDKNIIRYFMSIPEAAQLVMQAGYYADKGEIFVLDMGKPVKIIDLAKRLISLSGFKPDKDIDIIEVGLRPGEKMYEELRLETEVTNKTKNDLIFVNQIMGIELSEIDAKLAQLKKALVEDDAVKIKALILKLIK